MADPPLGPDGKPFDPSKWQPEDGPHPYHGDGYDRVERGFEEAARDAVRKHESPGWFLVGWAFRILFPRPDTRAPREDLGPMRTAEEMGLTKEQEKAADAVEKEPLDDLRADPRGYRATGIALCVVAALFLARGTIAVMADPLSSLGIWTNRLLPLTQEEGFIACAVGMAILFVGAGQSLRNDHDPDPPDRSNW